MIFFSWGWNNILFRKLESKKTILEEFKTPYTKSLELFNKGISYTSFPILYEYSK